MRTCYESCHPYIMSTDLAKSSKSKLLYLHDVNSHLPPKVFYEPNAVGEVKDVFKLWDGAPCCLVELLQFTIGFNILPRP